MLLLTDVLISHSHSPGRQWLKNRRDAMETDDAVWIAAMAALGDHASPDALLDELLADVARSHATSSPRYPPFKSRSRAIVSEPMDTSSSSASVSGETDDAKEPPRKRPRVRNYNPKKELDGLRRSKADLENLLALARQRRKTGRVTPMLLTDEMNAANCTPKEAMWMGVATRQYKLLRESKIQNEHLRAQVLNQMHIVRGFLRLVQRAQAGLPSCDIPRGLPTAATEAIFASKRKELLDIVAEMYESADEVFAGEPFGSSTLELNEITSSRFKDSVIPPGAQLASGSSRRYVLKSVVEVGDLLWELDLPRTRPIESFFVENIELADRLQIYHGTVRFSATAQATLLHVRRVRVWDTSRRSIVSVCTLWPNSSNESPWNALGLCNKMWIDLRESKPSDNGESHVEVRSRIESRKRQDLGMEASLAEARLLQEFATKNTVFVANRLHNKLDSLFLESSGQVILDL